MFRPILGLAPWCLVALLVTTSVPAAAASSTVAGPSVIALLTALPSEVRVAPGYVPGAGVRDLGPLPGDNSLQVVVGLSSADPTGLGTFVAEVAAPGTPAFRHPLSAAVADRRYGASPGAVRVAEQYFERFGLESSANPDGLLLQVRGPSDALARAFGTTFDRYVGPNGRTFTDHPSVAVLPNIAPWTGALGLGTLSQILPSIGPGAVSLAPTVGCGGSTSDLAPCMVHAAYAFNPLLANGTNGSGVRIGIVDAYAGSEGQVQLVHDLSTFASNTGLAVGNVSYLYPVPTSANLNSSGTNPAWAFEDALDLEWARAAAPGASLVMTFSPDAAFGLYSAIDWLVANGRVDVLSLSWGEPDVGVSDTPTGPCVSACNASTDGSYALLSPVLELAAAEGISTFAASGDCGAADGTYGVSTNFPASDPYVTGVGGTRLSVTTSGTYVSETGWGGNSSAVNGTCQNQGGSGGGFAPFPRPWWQRGMGTPVSNRGVPDIAMDASTPVYIEAEGGPGAVGGTSVGTPIWAGIAAVADQAAAAPLGFLNPSLYRILGGANYTADFHDITTGKNNYSAGVGWDAVTGIGTPKVSSLVRDLARSTVVPPLNLTARLVASPRSGPVGLTASFNLTAVGGQRPYAIEGIAFGDGNASLTTNGNATHTFPTAGVYSTEGFVVDAGGNTTTTPPVALVIGGGRPLAVSLNLSNSTPVAGAPVTLTAHATGGTGPYRFDFSFGDGLYEENSSATAILHRYARGTYCPTVVARDSATPPDGGVSPSVPIAVGGLVTPYCGSAAVFGVLGGPDVLTGTAPLTVTFSVAAYGGSGPPYGYNWTLSDGRHVGTENLTVTFSTGGRYTLTLQASDGARETVNLSWTIVVGAALPSGLFAVLIGIAGASIGAVVAVVIALRRRSSTGAPTL